MAEALRAAGARPGDRVAAFFPNCHLYLAAYYAALRSGLVLMPMNLRLAAPETAAVLRRGGARFLLGTPDRLASLQAARRDAGGGCSPAFENGWCVTAAAEGPDVAAAEGAVAGSQDVAPAGGALLYFTSGSTGEPKGVLLTLANLAAHAEMTLATLRFTPRDVWLHAAPMFHLADAWAIFTATASGAGQAFLPRWEGSEAFSL